MTHYVMIDGCLQRSSPETKRWARRAAKTVAKYDPNFEEAKMEALDEEKATRRSDQELLQNLKETE